MKDMNVEYIPQPCLNQQFKSKKQKSHHQLKPLLILFLMHLQFVKKQSKLLLMVVPYYI